MSGLGWGPGGAGGSGAAPGSGGGWKALHRKASSSFGFGAFGNSSALLRSGHARAGFGRGALGCRARAQGDAFARAGPWTLAGAACGVAGSLTAGVALADAVMKQYRVTGEYDALLATDEELRNVYAEMDKDGSGRVEKAELQAGMLSLGLPSSDDFVSDVMRNYDLDRDGSISFDEFSRYVRTKERVIIKAFSAMDASGQGFLTETEIIRAVNAMGINATAKDARRMIRLLDQNGDGTVSYAEFRRYCTMLPSAQLQENSTWCWLGSATDTVVMSPRSEPFKQLMTGGLAGVVARTCVAPLDRVRSIMMSGNATNALAAGGAILKEGGVPALWRGNLVSCLKVFPSSAIQFGIFESVKDVFLLSSDDGQLQVWQRLVAGSVAGAVSGFLMYPLESIKTAMQVPGGLQGSIVGVGKQLVKNAGGLHGLYPAVGALMTVEVVGTAVGFTLYDVLAGKAKELNGGRKLEPWAKGFVGGVSSCITMLATFPLEAGATRYRIQYYPGYSGPKFANSMAAVQSVIQSKGLGGVYSGIGVTCTRVFPMVGIVYFTWDIVGKAWGIGGLRTYDGAVTKIKTKSMAALEEQEEEGGDRSGGAVPA